MRGKHHIKKKEWVVKEDDILRESSTAHKIIAKETVAKECWTSKELTYIYNVIRG
jgi:hypothetical protein